MSDGLRLCPRCRDRETTGRLCSSCLEQEMIDDSVPEGSLAHWDELTNEEWSEWFLVWLAKHWQNPASPDHDL